MEVSLGNTMGATFVCTTLSAVLYGVTNLQVYLYYKHYQSDWHINKYSVALLWVLDTLHLSSTIAAVYHYLINSFGSLDAFRLVDWTVKLGAAVTVLIIVAVQTLYASRVWKLGRYDRPIWPIIVVMVVVSGYVIGIVFVVKACSITTFAELSDMSWIICTAFVLTTGIDVVIATVICYYLTQSKTAFSGTKSKIVLISRLSLVSGFLTSANSLAVIITYVTMPNSFVFLSLTFVLTKLYPNSFLAMLNARQNVRETHLPACSINVSKSTSVWTTMPHVARSDQLVAVNSTDDGRHNTTCV